jgi:hypothetical protein
LLKSFTNSFKLPQRCFAETIKSSIKKADICSSICKAIRLFNINGIPFAKCIEECCNNVVLVILIVVKCNQGKEELNRGTICYSSINVLSYPALSILKVSTNNPTSTVFVPFAFSVELYVKNLFSWQNLCVWRRVDQVPGVS